MYKHVLVPLDGSALSETALDYAVHLGGKTAQLTLLVVIPPPEQLLPFLPPEQSDGTETQVEGARQYLRNISHDLQKRHGISVQGDVQTGIPAAVIVERARSLNVNAIVMSTHGRSGMDRLIFGSVTYQVLGMAPCPLLVVPGRETARAASPADWATNPA